MLNIKENMLHAFVFVQIAFAVLAVLALAFAQAIGASINIVSVLAVFGGCVIVEMLVFAGIFAYMQVAGRDYIGALNDAAHAMKSTRKHVVDTTGNAVNTIKSAVEASKKQSASTEVIDAKIDSNGVQVAIEEPNADGANSDNGKTDENDDMQTKISNAKHARTDDEEK